MLRQRELQVSIKPAQADCIVAQLTALDCLFTFTFLSWQKTMQIYLLFVEVDCHCQDLSIIVTASFYCIQIPVLKLVIQFFELDN